MHSWLLECFTRRERVISDPKVDSPMDILYSIGKICDWSLPGFNASALTTS